MEFPETPSAPKKYFRWMEAVREFCTAKQISAVQDGDNSAIDEYPDGSVITVAGGGGGGSDFEQVTGAVNGVPSTLNVATDGEPWVEI